MFSVDGLVSGLDTTAIIEGSLSIQQRRIDRLSLQKQDILDEQAAFKSMEAQLLSLQGSMSGILRSTNNAFDQYSATSSDEDLLIASTKSDATAGTYRFRTMQLAQAQQLKSNGFASRTDEIDKGTLEIRVGNRAVANIEIGDNNNTVQGLIDSINAQASDVRATIVDDGSDSLQPLRILLTSEHTGSENQINLNFTSSGEGSAAAVDFSGPEVQAALDAQIRIGDGPGAITVASDTNEFDDLIPGVVVDLVRADPDKDVFVTVAADTSQTVDAVKAFVDSYNSVIDFINTNSEYDDESNTGGLLLGDRTAASVQSTLQTVVSTVVKGVNTQLNTLTSVGISTTFEGKLSLDSGRLQEVIDGDVPGVGIDDIRRLFAIDGQSDNQGVQFVLGNSNTQASPIDPATGNPLPFEVEINRAATQANLIADAQLGATTTIGEGNDELKLVLDAIEISLAIPHGDYTQTDLAKQVEALINASPDIGGREAFVGVQDNLLSIRSASYGRSSEVEILEGTAMASLGLTAGAVDKGVDVGGVFRVQIPGETEPITETAIGNGQILTGDIDNEYTADLRIRSTLTESQITPLRDAYMTVTRGIGASLDAAIDELLDTEGGTLTSRQDAMTRDLETIDENIARLEEQLESRREALTREFAALETTISELQSVGNSLASGLNSLVIQ